MKPMNDPARYAAQLVDRIVANQSKAQPDWWQQVMIELHDQLAEIFLEDHESGGRYTTLLENRAALFGMPKAGSTAPWKCPPPPPPWKPEPVESVNALRILALENQVAALNDWADIPCESNKPTDEGVTAKCIHDLIAEGMTGVTADIQREVNELYGIFGVAHQQILKLTARLDALETKTPR